MNWTRSIRRAFEGHLASCPDCAKELAGFKKLKEITDGVAFVEPEDRVWDEYWGGVYNRFERGTGWILFSVAAIALLIYGGFELIEGIIEDRTVGVLMKIGLLALIGGLVILFVSVAPSGYTSGAGTDTKTSGDEPCCSQRPKQ